jgi:hypothetical protein
MRSYPDSDSFDSFVSQFVPEDTLTNQQALQIRWSYGTEFVPLEGITGAPQQIRTSERWEKVTGAPLVSYVANVEAFSRRGKKRTLRLRYRKNDQSDEMVRDPENGARWGVSEINWDTSGLNASAKWIDEDDQKQLSGFATKVTVMGTNLPASNVRKTASVIVKLRPKQQELRNRLLYLDQVCVLTGEKEIAALDAAHIVPVKAGGHETVENAILLRADLHRLFDSGLLWFEVSAREAVARTSKSLSTSYKDMLTAAKLPEATFARVARALRLRAEMRDGKGLR